MSPLDRLALGIIAAVAAARPLVEKERQATRAELRAVVDAFLNAARERP